MQSSSSRSHHAHRWHHILMFIYMAVGAFIAAFALTVFFVPNRLIDGGVVGLAMILARLTSQELLPYFFLALNAPFIVFAMKHVGKAFVGHLLFASVVFFASLVAMPSLVPHEFHGEILEVVVIGGAILGVGAGLIIRGGGCVDGTEILGIIANKRRGFTVGQVVLACNVFVFGLAGFVFKDWHPPLLSLIAYVVVMKIMDTVIVGLDEMKSVLIISSKPKELTRTILHDMGLGLTVLYGRGGYSGAPVDILYIVIERLYLTELKELVYDIDPTAFIAIEDLHEVSSGRNGTNPFTRRKGISRVAEQAIGKAS